jgi:hypothetical protein
MNLENYQVVSGAKSARGHGVGMSRGSSSSGSAGMVETPQHEFDADGEEDGEEVMDIVVGEGKWVSRRDEINYDSKWQTMYERYDTIETNDR